jgi:hypothetical protein
MRVQPPFDGFSAKRTRQRRTHFHDDFAYTQAVYAIVKTGFAPLTG